MAQRRCPELNSLANQLLEAYRRFDEASSPREAVKADEDLVRVHRCLSAHRVGCLLCKFPNPGQDQEFFLEQLDDVEEFHIVDPPLRWQHKADLGHPFRTKRL